MKILLLYYSETGNTKKIALKAAEGIGENTIIKKISNINPETINQYNFLIFAFPIHGDDIPDSAKDFFKSIKVIKSPVGLILTHTAPKNNDSPKKCFEKLIELINIKNGEVIDKWNCTCENKNKVVVKWVKENMPDKYQNVIAAQGHPDENDLIETYKWGKRLKSLIK